MKNKKIVILLVVISMCLGLVACKNDDIENHYQSPDISGDNANDESGEILVNFEELEQEYFEFKSQFSEEVSDFIPALRSINEYLKAGEGANYMDYGVSSLLNSINRSEDYFSEMSYLMKDLNGDGINEFLLYSDTEELKNTIIGMYTMNSGDCYCILNSHENMRFSLCENDVIKMELLNEEYTSFCKLNADFGLDTLEFVEKITPEADAKVILDKYKEAKLELKKLK